MTVAMCVSADRRLFQPSVAAVAKHVSRWIAARPAEFRRGHSAVERCSVVFVPSNGPSIRSARCPQSQALRERDLLCGVGGGGCVRRHPGTPGGKGTGKRWRSPPPILLQIQFGTHEPERRITFQRDEVPLGITNGQRRNFFPTRWDSRRLGADKCSPKAGAMVLMGLDLSATAAAACSVPLDWDGQWRRVRTHVVGLPLPRVASDLDRAMRCETIARALVAFAHDCEVRECWIESYAFSKRTNAHTLAEVGGVVRLELVRGGIALRTANMSTARKLLLGKVPRKEAKQACHRTLWTAGSPPWTLDESDAFVAANLGLSEHAGAFCFAQEPEAA